MFFPWTHYLDRGGYISQGEREKVHAQSSIRTGALKPRFDDFEAPGMRHAVQKAVRLNEAGLFLAVNNRLSGSRDLKNRVAWIQSFSCDSEHELDLRCSLDFGTKHLEWDLDMLTDCSC